MNKIFLTAMLLCTLTKWTYAQCDKKIVWTSMKEEWLNGKGELQHTDQDKVVIEMSRTGITLNHNDDPNDAMTGSIKDFTCNWTEPYKNGKTVIKSDLMEGHGDVHDAILTVEGKGGQITITLQLNDKPDMVIRMYPDHHEEIAN